MAAGSVGLWIANPILWLWITARLQSTQARMGPYVLMLIGITFTAIAFAKLLAVLNRLYGRVTGTAPTVRVMLPWRSGLRRGRDLQPGTDERLPVSILDVVMVISVIAALVALLVYLAVVQPTPPGLQPGGSKS